MFNEGVDFLSDMVFKKHDCLVFVLIGVRRAEMPLEGDLKAHVVRR